MLCSCKHNTCSTTSVLHVVDVYSIHSYTTITTTTIHRTRVAERKHPFYCEEAVWPNFTFHIPSSHPPAISNDNNQRNHVIHPKQIITEFILNLQISQNSQFVRSNKKLLTKFVLKKDTSNHTAIDFHGTHSRPPPLEILFPLFSAARYLLCAHLFRSVPNVFILQLWTTVEWSLLLLHMAICLSVYTQYRHALRRMCVLYRME